MEISLTILDIIVHYLQGESGALEFFFCYRICWLGYPVGMPLGDSPEGARLSFDLIIAYEHKCLPGPGLQKYK